MDKKSVFTAAFTLAMLAHAAPNASAACNPPKFASTYNSVTMAYSYWHTTIVGGTLHARIWSGATDYTGTCDGGVGTQTGELVYPGLDPQNVSLDASLGDGCVPGCPSGSLSVKVWSTSPDGNYQEYVASYAPETPTGGVNFDFSANGHNMVASPRPRIATSGGRVGNNVLLNTLPEPLGGYFDGAESQLTACNYRAGSDTTNPGIRASLYPTLLATVPVVGGACAAAALTVDCSDITRDQWIAIQVVTTAGPDAIVGPPLRVKCNPALAEPKVKIDPGKKFEGAVIRN